MDCGKCNPFTSSTAPAGQAFINIGDVRLYGLELEMAYDSDTWFAKAGAALIRGEDTGNNISDSGNLNTVPPDELFVTLGYKVPDYDITLSATGRFVAAQDKVFGTPVGNLSESRRPSDGFATLDLAFDWKPSGERFKDLEFRAAVDNVFDTQYKEFLANDPAKGRTFKFSLIKKFSM
ncbi:MAG: TonB-dependent receptor, partial [Pseudomonadota bacterium]